MSSNVVFDHYAVMQSLWPCHCHFNPILYVLLAQFPSFTTSLRAYLRKLFLKLLMVYIQVRMSYEPFVYWDC